MRIGGADARQWLMSLAVILAILVVAEIGLRLADTRGEGIEGDRRWRSDAYSDPVRSRQTALDLHRFVLEPVPYTNFGLRANQHYPSLNVNSIRARGSEVGAPGNAKRILLLGGSFAFGFGATADDRTVAGALERGLRQQHPETPVEVINLGVPAFVTTQELIDLYARGRQLQPDLVIFLDGFNDVYVPTLGTEPGQPFPEYVTWKTPLRTVMMRSAVGEWMLATGRGVAGRRAVVEGGPNSPRGAALLGRIKELYVERIKEGEAASRAMDARFLHFVQPSLVGGAKPLSAAEDDLRSRIEGCKDLDVGHCRSGVLEYVGAGYEGLRAASRELRASSIASFDLAGIFDATTETRWIDLAHLADTGYSDVANAMIPMVYEALRR